jgi:lipopolysaccharide biosynthesis regulator YciM
MKTVKLKVEIDWTTNADGQPSPAFVESEIERAIQEAARDILRHAAMSHIKISPCKENEGPQRVIDALSKEIHSAKVSVLRGIHSGDRSAKHLIALVDEINSRDGDSRMYECEECGFRERVSHDSIVDGGGPVCPACDIDMSLSEGSIVESEVFKGAEAFVLRVKRVKDS